MRDELEHYVDRAKDVIAEAPQMSESNTKEMLVRRFIEILGWTFHPSEINLEYPVRIASRQTKVDYALLLDGTPTVFVEVKGLDTSLSDDHRGQLTSYMHNEEGVEWGLLANGEEYEFYRYDGSPSGVLLGSIQLEQLPQRSNLVRAISKASVEAGESEQIARRIRERQQAVSTLRAEKDDIADQITQLLTERIGDAIASVVETEAKELVDRVVESLENDTTEQVTRDRETKSAIVGSIRRRDIDGPPDAKVAIFPTRQSGIQFLRENNAWGFVRIGQKPDYVGMYVAAPEKKVRYFAEVEKIVPAREANLAKPPDAYTDMAHFDPDKKVVMFKSGTLHELDDPIPYNKKNPYSLVYTDLQSFRRAETTDDIL